MNREQQTREALIWALNNTPLTLPKEAKDPIDWVWDENDLSFVRVTEKWSIRFHVEAVVGVTKRRIAVLKWEDNDGAVAWEAEIPNNYDRKPDPWKDV